MNAGCGKRTVVQRAAEELGLHVVEYNCYDFLGASDGKTAAAVTNAFKTARKYVFSLSSSLPLSPLI
jgi:peroxin-6